MSRKIKLPALLAGLTLFLPVTTNALDVDVYLVPDC